MAATQATSAPPRRRLEPIAEPTRATPAPARARRPPPSPAQRRRGGLRPWLLLLFVIAVVAAGIVAYQALNQSSNKTVQLGSPASGKVNDAVDQLKQLIQDNTR